MEILNWNKKNVERRDKADYISSTNWYFRYPCLSSQLERIVPRIVHFPIIYRWIDVIARMSVISASVLHDYFSFRLHPPFDWSSVEEKSHATAKRVLLFNHLHPYLFSCLFYELNPPSELLPPSIFSISFLFILQTIKPKRRKRSRCNL